MTHSALSRQDRIWYGADAVDRRSAIFPKLFIAALCWIAMFFQQIEACSPDAFRPTPAVSQILPATYSKVRNQSGLSKDVKRSQAF